MSRTNNAGWTAGLGAGYDITRNLTARLEWQRYFNVGGDNIGGKTDYDVMRIAGL